MPMESKLTAKEACLILKAAKDAGARTISFRGLIVHFGVAAPSWPERPVHAPIPKAVASVDPAEKYLDKMEMQVKEQQLDELLIEDPLALEELIVQDELRDADDGTEA